METHTGRTSGSQFLWRMAMRSAAALGILLLCGLLLRSCLMQRGRQNLAAFEAESDQQDPGWRWEDILKARKSVPDEENAAPCVLAAGRLIPANWPQNPVAGPAKNDPDSTDTLKQRLRKLGPPERLSDGLAAELRAELAPLGPALTEARKVAGLPQGRYEITWECNLYATLLPHVQVIRRVAELLYLDVAVRTHDGDLAGALLSFRAIFNTGRSIGDEPLIISQLVRIAVVSLSVDALERLLAQGNVSDTELAELARLCQEEEKQATVLLHQIMRAERAAMAHMLNLAAQGEIDLQQLEGSRSGRFEQAINWPIVQPLVRYGEAPTLELMTRHLQNLKLPPAERRAAMAAFDQELRQMKADIHKHPHMIPALLLIPALTRIVESFDRYQAVLRSSRVALAVERYRLAHGRWPDSLDALTPALLASVPDDPFGSGPLRYRRLSDRVVVYSVGADAADNGGAIDWENQGKPGTDLGFRLYDRGSRKRTAGR